MPKQSAIDSTTRRLENTASGLAMQYLSMRCNIIEVVIALDPLEGGPGSQSIKFLWNADDEWFREKFTR